MPPKRRAAALPAEQPTRVSSRDKKPAARFAPYPPSELTSTTKKSTVTKPKKSAMSKSSGKVSTKRPADEASEDAPAAKRAKPSAKPTPKPTANQGKKRATKPTTSKPARAPAPPKPLPVINSPPTQKLDILVVGEGESGELGLGTSQNAVGVKRFRLNPLLSADTVGVVDLALGAMHAAALTHDNRILTWGVNDEGALGRDTTWDGVEDDDNDTGLNPHEVVPTAIPSDSFPNGTVFTQLAAGDSCTFAVTSTGLVYGWGIFRDNQGPMGFTKEVRMAQKPILIPGLQKIKSIECGSNHALALDEKGNVFAWGTGQQSQLGRRVVERGGGGGLVPREVGLPKKQIKFISTGSDHSFAIAKNNNVYAWGLNNYGQCGISENAGEGSASVIVPTIVKQLKEHKMVMIKGGAHHSLGLTDDGACLAWGRTDGGQVGLDLGALPDADVTKNEKGAIALLNKPTPIPNLTCKYVTTSSDHSIVINTAGRAYSWGFSGLYQTGLGVDDEQVDTATLVDNASIRERNLIWAGTGSQYSMVAAAAAATTTIPVVNGTTA